MHQIQVDQLRMKGTIILIFTFAFCSDIFAQHQNHNHGQQKPIEQVKCHSCFHIQNVNISNSGCENARPPSSYVRSDCFGFGNLQVAGAVRHPVGAQQFGHGQIDPLNTHCVTISGRTTGGNAVMLRGCDNLAYGTTYEKKTCFEQPDFTIPLQGMVRNVQICYCKGNACNGASNLKWGLAYLIPVVIYGKRLFTM